MPVFSLDRSRPQRLVAVYKAEDSRAMALTAARLLDWMGKRKLGGIHLVSSWVGRRIAPLQRRSTLMCSYTGVGDASRSTRKEWRDSEVLSLMNRLTSLLWSSFSDPPLAYSATNPAPSDFADYAGLPPLPSELLPLSWPANAGSGSEEVESREEASAPVADRLPGEATSSAGAKLVKTSKQSPILIESAGDAGPSAGTKKKVS